MTQKFVISIQILLKTSTNTNNLKKVDFWALLTPKKGQKGVKI